MSKSQGSDNGPQFSSVAALDAVVSPGTPVFQATRDQERFTLKIQPLEECPARLRIGLAIVDACPIGHEEQRGIVFDGGAPEITDRGLAEHEKPRDEEGNHDT